MISSLLMAWQHKEPRPQQSWFDLIRPSYFGFITRRVEHCPAYIDGLVLAQTSIHLMEVCGARDCNDSIALHCWRTGVTAVLCWAMAIIFHAVILNETLYKPSFLSNSGQSNLPIYFNNRYKTLEKIHILLCRTLGKVTPMNVFFFCKSKGIVL